MFRKLVLSIALCPLIVASVVAQSAPLSTILYYKFETGPNGAQVQSAVDSGPFGLTGAVTGALTYSNNVPKGGGKFSLNATPDVDYIVLAQTQSNSALLNQTQNFMLSVFAEPTGGTTLDDIGDLIAGKLISNGSGSCLTTYAILYSAFTNKFVGGVCGADGSTRFMQSAHTFPLNSGWYKVALKYTTKGAMTTISLTVNSKMEGKIKLKSFPGPALGNAGFQVGASNFVCDTCQFRRNFIGYIDDVKLAGQAP